MTICPRFPSQRNFLDPQLTPDGRLYAPLRYKRIMQDCYAITRNTNIDYRSVMEMSITEREYIMSFLMEEAQAIKKNNEELQRQLDEQRNSRYKP